MKKILLTFTIAMFSLTACYTRQADVEYIEVEKTPGPAYYSDWDRAIRADTDMHNMFAGAPRTVSKPLDMYMAMSLALKYNYSRRMVSYEQAIIESGQIPVNRLPEVISRAGYVNTDNVSDTSSELKAVWNVLDISTVYYQTINPEFQKAIAYEQSRKVVHNIMQETRVLYWKSLMAQKLLPVMDEMIEFMTLEVDEMNIAAKDMAANGKDVKLEDVVKKREYMEAIKELSAVKRDAETAQSKLASFMGLHPSTEFKLVGKEYGNFEIPAVKNDLAGLEWLALTNRPEMRAYDTFTKKEDLKIIMKEQDLPKEREYKKNSKYYNQLWADKGRELSINVYEDVKNPNVRDMETVRRQRMSMLILSQVYVAWARYVSSAEDYQINMEIANISEDIAESVTYTKGYKDSQTHLEAARAIIDEANAYKSYIDFQDSLGNLYATIGVDALPYYVIQEKPSNIAVYLRGSQERWKKGEFIPDSRPYALKVPNRRPVANLSSQDFLPDVSVSAGEKVEITVPADVFVRMDFSGKVVTKAGLVGDKPLPAWLTYDESTRTFRGIAVPSEEGEYNIKLYVMDSKGKNGYLTFKIMVSGKYVPGLRLKGLTGGGSATVLQKCQGAECK